MATEIERKFLVKNLSFKNLATPYDIKQGYICSDENRVVRVRIKGDKAYITIKNATIGYSRDEFEYEIPIEDAEIMLRRVCIQPIIEKTRFVLRYGGFIWEIDEFHGENEGLIIAEIELDREDATFEKPDFIGEEVTGEERYYNAVLYVNPYSKWK